VRRLQRVAVFLAMGVVAGCASAPPPREEAPVVEVPDPFANGPLAIELEGRVVEDGHWAIRALVHVSERVDRPPVIRAMLPPGASLISGNAQESLPASGVDAEQVRWFHVANATAPVRIVVGVVAEGALFTVSAHWPARDTATPAVGPPPEDVPAPTRAEDVRIDPNAPTE